MIDKDELLIHYFQGTLSEKDKVVFDELIAKDPEFKAQFTFEKNLQVAIKNSERNKLKQKLKTLEEVIEHKTQTQKPSNKSWFTPMRIAASVAILIAASWFFYTNNVANNPEQLFANNYEMYPNTVYAITRGNSAENTLEQKAFTAYEANDLPTATRLFQELQEKSGLDYIDFYLAQTYLAQGEILKSVALFEKILEEKTDFKTEALWYAALGNIKTGQETKAILQLEALVLDGSYKKKEAENLLKKLK